MRGGSRYVQLHIKLVLWKIIKGWKCFFYATDSYAVNPKFIDEADQIASKSYMTGVEGENTKFLALLSTLA